MSEMFPLLKCKHPVSVLRELHRGCFPSPLIYRNLAIYRNKGYNYENKIFIKNAKQQRL
ncbi:hypothetical protein T11_2321 [Trichinella zimbabwensis]|uniref:Uncharacterized protein n=1 Tax=Trichinella zimbabwensis TaxID=268475 RepID=A0A0V1GHR1_9BILA|nr:hypothetical protein T11_2321 [Trichinella zimbabwensis]